MTLQAGSDHDLLIEIKTMLAGVISRQDRADERDADKETRLRGLERFKAQTIGAGWLLGLLSSSGLIVALIQR